MLHCSFSAVKTLSTQGFLKKKSEVRYNPPRTRTPHRPRRVREVSAPKRQINGTDEQPHRNRRNRPVWRNLPRFRRGNTKQNTADSYRLSTLLWGECEHRIRLVTAKPLPAFCSSAGGSPAPTFIKPSSIRRTIIEG